MSFRKLRAMYEKARYCIDFIPFMQRMEKFVQEKQDR